MTTKEQDYIYRQENVNKIDDAIKLMEYNIKNLIVKQGFASGTVIKDLLEEEIELYTRILSGLNIIWGENMIKWLFYEHGAFEEEQIDELLDKRELKQKWQLALSTAFYRAFIQPSYSYDPNNPLKNKNDVLVATNISAKDKNKFQKLYDFIENEMVLSITIRNKIQHGEWVRSYIKDNSSYRYDPDLTLDVENDNILVSRLKRHQIKAMYDMIKDIAVFKNKGKFKLNRNSNPFSHFFGKRYGKILSTQRFIVNSDYEKYKCDLVASATRGVVWKNKNLRSVELAARN